MIPAKQHPSKMRPLEALSGLLPTWENAKVPHHFCHFQTDKSQASRLFAFTVLGSTRCLSHMFLQDTWLPFSPLENQANQKRPEMRIGQ